MAIFFWWWMAKHFSRGLAKEIGVSSKKCFRWGGNKFWRIEWQKMGDGKKFCGSGGDDGSKNNQHSGVANIQE